MFGLKLAPPHTRRVVARILDNPDPLVPQDLGETLNPQTHKPE